MINIPFLGLRQNMKMGNKAITEVKREFPKGFVSNTHIETFSSFPSRKKIQEAEGLVNQTRDLIDEEMRFGETKEEATRKAVKKTNAANCGEQSYLVSQKLKKNGTPNKIVNMDVYDKNNNFKTSHTFCVISDNISSLRESKPDTWDDTTVVVDMWAGVVDSAKRALNQIERMFKIKKDDKVIFHSTYY